MPKLTQSYYADKGENRESSDAPLVINCTGEHLVTSRFSNRSPQGRRDYYLIYMTAGSLELSAGGVGGTLNAGELILIPPKTPYSYHSLGQEGEPVGYYWLHFTGGGVEDIIASAGLRELEILKVGLHEDISEEYERLFSEFRKKQERFDYTSIIRAQSIFLCLSEHIENATRPTVCALDRSVKHIHAHIRSPLSVSSLARMEHLSVSRYRQLFHEIFSTSPSEYITALRIRRACDLLSHGDLSTERIAEQCGYSDRLYFQRVFKRHTGYTPGKYRKIQQKS